MVEFGDQALPNYITFVISVQLQISGIIESIISGICLIIYVMYNWYFVLKISYP